MGGSSTEFSFSPSEVKEPKNQTRFQNISFSSDDYSLYSISYEELGHNAADSTHQRIVIEKYHQIGDFSNQYNDPCYPTGGNFYANFDATNDTYVVLKGKILCKLQKKHKNSYFFLLGVGNPSECEQIINKIVDTSFPCNYSHCSIKGIYQPEVNVNFSCFFI